MIMPWPMVRLGEVLIRSAESAVISPDVEYCEITVKLWGKGVVLRGMVSGAQISGSRRFVARTGQFILSRIDARNGATGIVPTELNGALVTNDFPLFNLDRERVDAAFLGWLSKTQKFVRLCMRASEGTTNRVRLQEERFLSLEIPLPPLSEQQRIVRWIEEIATKITEAQSLRKKAVQEAEALVTSKHIQLAGERKKRIGEILRLHEDAVLVLPQGSYPQLGVKSFGAGLFKKSPVSGTETTYKRFNRLFDGAFVLSQVKGWEGAVAVCPTDLAGSFVSPEYRTFRCIERELRPGYLANLVRTTWFWKRLSHATHGVGARRERTRPEQFLELELPMPNVDQQAQAERMFEKINLLKHLQANTTTELDAMLPSALDQAFMGKL
ncbi:MAG: restriction endonuclease subunit S [Syntrophobacteraceae bacterium]